MAIFWKLQPPLWSSLLMKPDFLRFRCSSGHVISKFCTNVLKFIDCQLYAPPAIYNNYSSCNVAWVQWLVGWRAFFEYFAWQLVISSLLLPNRTASQSQPFCPLVKSDWHFDSNLMSPNKLGIKQSPFSPLQHHRYINHLVLVFFRQKSGMKIL